MTKSGRRQRALAKRPVHIPQYHTWDRCGTDNDNTLLGLDEYVANQKWTDNKDKYASTLPVDMHCSSSKTAAKVLERTKARWDSWYARALAINEETGTGLGTLMYLPQEIREKIYQAIFDEHLNIILSIEINSIPEDYYLPGYVTRLVRELDRIIRSGKVHYQPCVIVMTGSPWVGEDWFESEHPDVLDLWWYLPPPTFDQSYALNIRSASLSLRDQIDQIFLAKSLLKFSCSKALVKFISNLPTYKHNYLRRLIIQLSDECYCCTKQSHDHPQECFCWGPAHLGGQSWKNAFERLPAKSLQSVTSISFDLDEKAHPVPFEGRAGYVVGSSDAYDGSYPAPVTDIGNAMEFLKAVAEGIGRLAPKAKLSLYKAQHYLEEDRNIMEAVLSDNGGEINSGVSEVPVVTAS